MNDSTNLLPYPILDVLLLTLVALLKGRINPLNYFLEILFLYLIPFVLFLLLFSYSFRLILLETDNYYKRFVLNKFLASDISWMPVGKALTMPGTHNNNAAEENKKGSGGGAAGGGGLGGDDESLKETVDEMKGELKALAEQMDGIGKQMTLLLSTLNNRN